VHRGRQILLVEDNPDDVTLTLRAFERNNIINEVLVAQDGAEAIDYLLPEDRPQGADLPTVVLLDLKLPKISGLDVLRRIRDDQRTRRLPVVILTSWRENSRRVAPALGV